MQLNVSASCRLVGKLGMSSYPVYLVADRVVTALELGKGRNNVGLLHVRTAHGT